MYLHEPEKMWNIPSVVAIFARRTFKTAISNSLRRNQPAGLWMCTSATSNAIPDAIIYPNGDKRLQEYLDKLKQQSATTTRDQNNPLLFDVLQRYEHRLSIVDQYKEVAQEMANESDSEIVALVSEEKQQFAKLLTEIDEALVDGMILLSDDDTSVSTTMVEIQAGVGGQEAMLFARELADMYENYVKLKKWNYTIIEEDSTGLGGVRSFSFVVQGHDAYDTLKYEAGVHRVQRIPKTERSGRIHTSTAVVLIVPCADDIQIKINPNDLRIETKRASGPGGQNVNKLESAVRIVHIPTGIAVECQEERTQIQNKNIAMKKLHGRLYQVEFTKQAASQKNMRKSQIGARTRNEKLRTYNYAQNRITDHRVSGGAGTVHNLDEFLAGNDYFGDFLAKINKAIRRQTLSDILDKKL